MNGTSQTKRVLLSLKSISKSFPGVKALDSVDFDVREGEIHSVVGVNGAGKSTLVNVLGGSVVPEHGEIYWNGEHVQLHPPQRALRHGIAIVHQELSLFPELDVATNISISRLTPRDHGWLIRDEELRARAREALERVGLNHLSPRKIVGTLSPGERQLIEIARTLNSGAKLLILDEPTSSLPEAEVKTLFDNLVVLKKQGISIIFVTHHLDEVFRISDCVTVFRNGRNIGTNPIGDIDHAALVPLILGRSATEQYDYGEKPSIGEEALRVENLQSGQKVRNVSFSLHRGEILGIAGLLGSGRTETARAIFGLESRETGTVWINGSKVHIKDPQQAIRHGMGFITEDRRREGLLLQKPIIDNVAVAVLRRLSGALGFMRSSLETKAAQRRSDELHIATPSIQRNVATLSGGNQQKVVLGKWLETEPTIFILDEPTRGIDVGTKAEFYRLIVDLASKGVAILLITEDIMELASLCDRVLIMRRGRITGELSGNQITSSNIILAINRDGEA